MNKRTMIYVVVLTLLLAMSLAACRREVTSQPGENSSTIQPSFDGQPTATDAAVQTMPSEPAETDAQESIPATTEMDWGLGEEDLTDIETTTDSAKPVETKPADPKPAGTEPIGTEPVETESSELQWELGEEDF